MALFKETDTDAMSDILKHITLNGDNLPETTVAAWFVNSKYGGGPQFFVGEMVLSVPYKIQPLYATKANSAQQPVAWASDRFGIITQDVSMYRNDLKWTALYTAR